MTKRLKIVDSTPSSPEVNPIEIMLAKSVASLEVDADAKTARKGLVILISDNNEAGPIVLLNFSGLTLMEALGALELAKNTLLESYA